MTLMQHAIDPMQRSVFFAACFCKKDEGESLPDNFSASMQKVIETPSCIIEMPDARVYYLRSLGRKLTLLVEANFEKETWTAVSCWKNPAPSFLQTLLVNGNFIPGSTLD